MVNPSEHHVALTVTGFGDDPADLTRLIGVPPSRTWARGDPTGHGGRHTHSRWVLQSRLPSSEPVEKHFDDLLDQLRGREEAVREVARRYSAQISLAAYWREFNPAFQLSVDILKRLADLGLPLDFDLYCFGDLDAAS